MRRQKIRITKHTMTDRYWLVYTNNDGETKHIDLSGCSNSFLHATGYISKDALKAVGLRYEEDGQLCYELFNVGHTVFFAPLRPSVWEYCICLLTGKKIEEVHKSSLYAFEEALNQGGWKTVDRTEDLQ